MEVADQKQPVAIKLHVKKLMMHLMQSLFHYSLMEQTAIIGQTLQRGTMVSLVSSFGTRREEVDVEKGCCCLRQKLPKLKMWEVELVQHEVEIPEEEMVAVLEC